MGALPSRVDRSRPLRPNLPEHSSFKLIGLGGVGSIAARYLAVLLASFGREIRFGLIDGDAFEPSNASRMFFASHGNKAEVVRDELLECFKNSRLSLLAIPHYLSEENVEQLILENDNVILAVDNHATRKLVNDFCASQRRNISLISGGNDGVGPDASGRELSGTYGNCQIYIRRDGVDITPSLTRYHPEIAEPADQLPTEVDCLELATSTPQILMANLMAASAILNALWLHLCGALHYGEICFDIADGLMRPLSFGTRSKSA